MARARRETEARDGVAALSVGCGLDVHPLRPGRTLVLGGVIVPHDRGLAGHSDADVLSHAICDAVLGALGLPDMGTRFPDTDPDHRGRSSLLFLREVGREVRMRRRRILNVDAAILAEAPRLAPHLEAMRSRIADALGCPAETVGLKAKRFEGIGAVGRGEGMMAQAVVLLAGAAEPRRGPGGSRLRGRTARTRRSPASGRRKSTPKGRRP
jgi:2-C-methyl-D-erythritol 2,4-cyclodiphosphate synthase